MIIPAPNCYKSFYNNENKISSFKVYISEYNKYKIKVRKRLRDGINC